MVVCGYCLLCIWGVSCFIIACFDYTIAKMSLFFYLQSSYDTIQDDRFWNYVQADAILSSQVTTELGGIKWILGTIAGAIILGLIGWGFSKIAGRKA